MKRTLILIAAAMCLAAGCNPDGGLDPNDVPSVKVLHMGDVVDGGVVIYVDPIDSTSGKVMELDYVEELKWCDLCSRVGCLSKSDGVANTAILRADKYYPENYPALMHCDELGADWYLPAIDEWQAVYNKWNGSSSKTENTEARTAFDAMLAAAGAKPFNPNSEQTENGQSYWSSTESETTNTNAYYLRTGVLSVGASTKKSTNRLTRCMKVIGSLTPAPTITLSEKTVTLESSAGSYASVSVKTNKEDIDYAFADSTSAEWLTVVISKSVVGNTIIVKAKTANEGKTNRTATIRVYAGQKAYRASETLFVAQEPGIKQVSHLMEIYDGGLIFWQNPEEETDVKIMSLKRLAATSGWCDLSEIDTQTGALDANDGEANTAAILALPAAAKYYAAQYCKSMGEGWYLPATNELFAIGAAYYGVATYEMIDKSRPDALLTNAPAQYKARQNFEKILKDNGGDVFNSMADDANGDSYWGSTEDPGRPQYAIYMRIGAFSTDYMAKKGGARYARCIKHVTYKK